MIDTATNPLSDDLAVLPRTDVEWQYLLGLLPGYDPMASTMMHDFEGAEIGECEFHPAEASLVIEFFHERITHVKGEKAKQPFILERWQQAFIANLFGWMRPDGTRRYRKALLYVPRKNGKSPFVAGIGLYMLSADGESGAENYCAASDREQAALVFDHAKGMVRQEERLSDHLRVYKGVGSRSIAYDEEGSYYKVIPADEGGVHGFNIHFVGVDELHVIDNAEYIAGLVTGTAGRRQPLTVYLTTADYMRESLCNEQHEYALRVMDDPSLDPTFLPCVYEAHADKDDWTDPKVWRRANPNLGVSVNIDYLVEACREAQEKPRLENTFKRLHLNMMTDQDVQWISLDAWDRCTGVVPEAELAGRPCYAGLDLSSTSDTTSFGLVFPWDDGSFVFKVRIWVPGKSLDMLERKHRVPYSVWAREGFIEPLAGARIDYKLVKKAILADAELYDIREIPYDPHNAPELVQSLEDDHGLPMVLHRQGFLSMSSPSKAFEKAVVDGKIIHNQHPVLRWMVGNCAVKEDEAGNIKPIKTKSKGKIDAVVALVMGLGRATLGGNGQSIYETEGLMTL